jgi:tetratricopeptide (TPR) repeat protein
MTEAERPRFILLGSALVFIAAMALYATAVPRELLWDDDPFVGNNSFVQDCSNISAAVNPLNLFKVLPVRMGARPVVNATILADVCAGGGASSMHLTNSLVHAFNAVLVFLLIFTLSGSGLPALFGALVFALHPAAAEAVNVITFRSHLLGFFFFTAGLIAAVFHSVEGGFGLAFTAAACYLLAMLSVETAIVLPAAALSVVYFREGRKSIKRIMPLAYVLAALAVFYLWFRTPRSGYAMPGVSHPGVYGPSVLYPGFLFPAAAKGAISQTFSALTLLPWRMIYHAPLARIYTMARITLGYFADLVLPLRLSQDYSPSVITSAAAGLLPLAADLAITAAAILLFLRKRLEGLGLVLLLIALSPAMNIWPIYNIKADRYLYLPLAGFSLAAAAVFALASRSGGRRRLYLMGAAWLWLGTLVFLSISRRPEFKDNLSFFSAAVERDPAIPRAQLNLAAAYMRLGNCSAAVAHVAAAEKLDPGNYQLGLRMAFTLARCGRRAEASERTDSLLERQPRDPDALYLAGVLRLRSDKRAAAGFLKKSLKADPDRLETRLTLLLAENSSAAKLSPAERLRFEDLKKFYEQLGLAAD